MIGFTGIACAAFAGFAFARSEFGWAVTFSVLAVIAAITV